MVEVKYDQLLKTKRENDAFETVVQISPIDPTDSPYTVKDTDINLIIDTDTGAVTVNLPAGENGRRLTIKNSGSSGNDITVNPSGADTIEGDSSFAVHDAESIQLLYETTQKWVIK